MPEKKSKKPVKGIPLSSRNGKPSPTPRKKAPKAKPKKASKPISPESNGSGHPLPPQEEDPLQLLFPDGLETLLEVPYRKALPQLIQAKDGPKQKLPEIIKFAPKLYAKMIGMLRNGVSPNVASEVCGIVERTFYKWGEQGAYDANHVDEMTGEPDPIDSYYSRFYMDVRRAIATKASECEMDIASKDSRKWLSIGPGKIFGGKWGKNPEKAALPSPRAGDQQALPAPSSDDIVEGVFSINHQASNSHGSNGQTVQEGIPSLLPNGSQGTGHTLPLSANQEYEALSVLEGIGQITLSPAMKKAYEDQLSLDHANNDPDAGEALEGEVEDE